MRWVVKKAERIELKNPLTEEILTLIMYTIYAKKIIQ